MKILIWGTGKIAETLLKYKVNAEIIGFIQTNKTVDIYMDHTVYSPDKLPDRYDYIFVANTYGDQIWELCNRLHVDDGKIIYLCRGVRTKYKVNDEIRGILGEANMTRYASEYGMTEDSFFKKDKEKYSELNRREAFAIKENELWPVIADKYADAGTVGNYFWQDLWAARLIIESGKKVHFDIGSRLDGFIAHLLAAKIDVTMIDVREFPVEIAGLHTIVDDATSLHQIADNSIESMSALCSLEHFGLGRYGDPIDPEACFTCFDNIQKKLAPGGILYISVPIGRERVEFNAHRVFYPDTIIQCFDGLQLVEFSAASQGKIEFNCDIHAFDHDKHNGEFRYGLFQFVKKNG
jgi:hypothetical protein